MMIAIFHDESSDFYILSRIQHHKKNRTIILPECEIDGTNYKRCDPDTMISNGDKTTCAQIEDLVCNENLKKEYKDYCECIGLVETTASPSLLRGVPTQ